MRRCAACEGSGHDWKEDMQHFSDVGWEDVGHWEPCRCCSGRGKTTPVRVTNPIELWRHKASYQVPACPVCEARRAA